MNRTVLISLLFMAAGSMANAMTVTEGQITGKSNLIAVADISVNGKAESILTDSNGFSLYTFEQDAAGVSQCSGACLTEWPPEHAPAGSTVTAPFDTIKGNDGQPQLTLNGLPLYHYSSDTKPGEAFGQYPGWDAIVVTN
jgi:predicted lipoprotein with Yx(FWY)xxD motif